MQQQLFKNVKFYHRNSKLIVIGNFKAIHLSEGDRNSFLDYFREPERSVIVRLTYDWLVANQSYIKFNAGNARKLKAHLKEKTKTTQSVRSDVLRITFRRHNLFLNFLRYHYLIDLHRHHAIPFSSYNKYYDRCVSSARWAQLRILVMLKQSFLCATPGCCAPFEELHHKNYLKLGRETLDDVVGYCCECHKKEHGHIKIKTQQFKQLKLKLAFAA